MNRTAVWLVGFWFLLLSAAGQTFIRSLPTSTNLISTTKVPVDDATYGTRAVTLQNLLASTATNATLLAAITNVVEDTATSLLANKLDTTNGTAVALGGSLTNVTLDGATLAQAFAYNVGRSSGTNAYFNAGKLTFRDGQVLSFAGGSVACIASRTNFVGINLFTGTLHALRRGVDHGTVFIARVVCDGSSITSVSQGPIELPPGRVERFKAGIANSQHKLKLASFGNSIMASAYGDTTNQWMTAVFSSSASPTTYQLANTSGLTWKDYSYGGQKSREALMFLGKATTPLLFISFHAASYVYGLDYIARNGTSAYETPADGVRGADLAVFYPELRCVGRTHSMENVSPLPTRSVVRLV